MTHRQPWPPEEDDLLRTWHAEGVGRKVMAQRLRRHPAAVMHRIRKLGLRQKGVVKYERVMVVLDPGMTDHLDVAAMRAGVTRARFVRNVLQAALAAERSS